MNRPNIIYIHSHNTGRYIQPYGHAVPAPHLQRLAGQGVLFRQAFCVAPTCSPSRAALETGQCPHSAGQLGLAHLGWTLRDFNQHWVQTLRAAGYRSTLIGIQHITKSPEQIGYDEIVPMTGDGHARRVAGVVPKAIQFLNQQPRQPFFLNVGLTETHIPFYEPGPAEDARYTLPPAFLPDAPEVRRNMAAFKAAARIMDRGMGAAIHALDANGLGDNTLVICTTDHGLQFPRGMGNLTDHGMGVFLILRGPGGFTGGKVCDAMVSHIDLFPTICELIGIGRPAWLQGESLLPLMRGEKEEIHEEVFGEVTYHAAYEPMRAARTTRWKYIRRFDGRTRPVLVNGDDGPSKTYLLQQGWADLRVDEEQLYDLVFDPNEANNLAGDPAHAATLADMRARLDRWMRATGDPILKGPVPLGPGCETRLQPDDVFVGNDKPLLPEPVLEF